MTQISERNQSLYDAAENAFTSEGGFVAPATEDGRPEVERAADEARRRVMEEASVTWDGRHYYYHGHRYSGLVDAVDQSMLMRSQPSQEHPPGPFIMTPTVNERTDADTELMASLDISFRSGMFCFETYRYDRLEDAIGYAKLRRTPADAVESIDAVACRSIN